MSDDAPKYSLFTRINLAIGVVVLSVGPMFFQWSRISSDQMDEADWSRLLAIVLLIQALLFVAVARCSTQDLGYWRGMTSIAACVRTGWIYADVLVASIVIPIAVGLSMLFSLTPRATLLFHKMVYVFYDHRMVQ